MGPICKYINVIKNQIFSDNETFFFLKVVWIYIGRIVTGFASGSYSVIVPLYTSEIADKEIRGSLGSYFQLQVNVGILFVYILGCYVSTLYFLLISHYKLYFLQLDVFGLSVACAIVPLIFLCFLVLIPESPLFYLIKGDIDNARLSLRFFRGRLYNVDPELNTMKESLDKVYKYYTNIYNLLMSMAN